MFLGGFMISPTLIAMVHLVEQQVPSSRLTEALTWTTTGMAVGIAPGAAVVGSVVDAHGASAGFLVPLVAGLLGSAVAWTATSGDRPARDVNRAAESH
jgi:predicted MFS family arabinose efflux permease